MPANTQRGLLKVASELQAQGSVDRTGTAGGLATVASSLAQVGSDIGKIADHAAAVEGEEAGRLAGLDPEFRPTKAPTIRGEAYDKAGLQVYGARTRETFAAQLEEAYDAHKDNPQALAAALYAKRSFIGASLQEVRPELELMFEKSRLTFMRQAARAQVARVRTEQTAALETDLTLGVKQLQQRAYSLGLDTTADEVLASDLEELGKTLTRRGMDGKPLVTAGQARKVIERARGEVNDARLTGAFERLPTAEAKAKFIEQFKADFGKSEGIARHYDFDGFERISGKMEAGVAKEVSARNTLVRAAREDIKSIEKRAEKGFPVPPAEMAAIEAKVATAGDAETSAKLENAKGLLDLQETARTWSPAQMDTALAAGRARLQQEGATEPQVARFTLLESLDREMRTELKADPLGWAARTGTVPVTPLDFSTAEAATSTVKARIAQAEEVGARYGQAPVYLRPDEKRALATATAQGGEQALGIAAAIAGAGGEKAPRMMAEIFDAGGARCRRRFRADENRRFQIRGAERGRRPARGRRRHRLGALGHAQIRNGRDHAGKFHLRGARQAPGRDRVRQRAVAGRPARGARRADDRRRDLWRHRQTGLVERPRNRPAVLRQAGQLARGPRYAHARRHQQPRPGAR